MEKTEATCGTEGSFDPEIIASCKAFTQTFLGTMTNNPILYLDSLPSSNSNGANKLG
jgi:hypothetical protein